MFEVCGATVRLKAPLGLDALAEARDTWHALPTLVALMRQCGHHVFAGADPALAAAAIPAAKVFFRFFFFIFCC